MKIQFVGHVGLASAARHDRANSIAKTTHMQFSFGECQDEFGRFYQTYEVVMETTRLAAVLLYANGQKQDALDLLMRALIDKAMEGRTQIENGDVYRHELPDAVFTKLVPTYMEDEMIAEMQRSGDWLRLATGWCLKTDG